jgi:hypothetical protein
MPRHRCSWDVIHFASSGLSEALFGFSVECGGQGIVQSLRAIELSANSDIAVPGVRWGSLVIVRAVLATTCILTFSSRRACRRRHSGRAHSDFNV